MTKTRGLRRPRIRRLSRGGPQPEDKCKGKEVQHFEDALTIKDVVSKAKDVESKSKAGDAKSKTVEPNEDPPQAKV